ncbi:hypothetical protein KJ780_00105 [Candidatus Micrarchaeota archaeon]|nr:hypothetical protein [Candidatus Micrarchaeota archaeon]
MSSLRYILLAVFSILLLFTLGCTQDQPQPTPEPEKVVFGDTVLVDYIIKANFTNMSTNATYLAVYDTTMESVANQHGIMSGRTLFGPQVFNTSNGGSFPAFARGLVGVEVGGNKTFVLSPEDAFGPRNDSLVFTINRTYSRSLYEWIPKIYIEQFNVTYSVGDIINSQHFDMEVVNVTNQSVVVRYNLEVNRSFLYAGLMERVVSIDNDTMLVEVLAYPGVEYNTKLPNENVNVTATVISKNETHIIFDANGPLAGKDVEFTVFIRKIYGK